MSENIISKISKHLWKEVFCLDILALFTAAGAAWQDLHFRKVSNRYLAICLGLAILLYMLIGIKPFAFGQSFDYVMLTNRKVNLMTNSVSDDALRSNMASDSTLNIRPNMTSDSALNIRPNMASDSALNIRLNMVSDSSSNTIENMMMVMVFNIGGGMAVPVLLLGWAFRLRKIGAGDIKLLAVLGAMMGPERILNCMLWTCLIALALEGTKCLSPCFVFFAGKARTNSRNHTLGVSERNLEELRSDDGKTKARVQKREGIPLALPVFLSTVVGICGLY